MSTLSATIGRGATGSRPAASEAGRLYYDTTAQIWYRDNGSSWDNCTPASLTNPMTHVGALIYGGTGGNPTELTVGTQGAVLGSDGTNPGWVGGMQRIADSLLGADTANFDLTSIPAGLFKHLRLVLSLRSDRAGNTSDTAKLLVNNSSSAIYDYVYGAEGTGSSYPGYLSEAYGQTSAIIGFSTAATAPAGVAGIFDLLFYDYASTTFNKQWAGTGGIEFASSSQNLRLAKCSGVWASTAAINRLTISPVNGSNWKSGCRATLYGWS